MQRYRKVLGTTPCRNSPSNVRIFSGGLSAVAETLRLPKAVCERAGYFPQRATANSRVPVTGLPVAGKYAF
jgi:hypothetical protein